MTGTRCPSAVAGFFICAAVFGACDDSGGAGNKDATAGPDLALVEASVAELGAGDGPAAEAALADLMRGDRPVADGVRPDTPWPDATKPDALRPDALRPDAPWPDATIPDAPWPDLLAPDTAGPGKIYFKTNRPSTDPISISQGNSWCSALRAGAHWCGVKELLQTRTAVALGGSGCGTRTYASNDGSCTGCKGIICSMHGLTKCENRYWNHECLYCCN